MQRGNGRVPTNERALEAYGIYIRSHCRVTTHVRGPLRNLPLPYGAATAIHYHVHYARPRKPSPVRARHFPCCRRPGGEQKKIVFIFFFFLHCRTSFFYNTEYRRVRTPMPDQPGRLLKNPVSRGQHVRAHVSYKSEPTAVRVLGLAARVLGFFPINDGRCKRDSKNN